MSSFFFGPTSSSACSVCRGQDGTPKVSYGTQSEATSTADRLRLSRHVYLRAYLCEHGCGWHLTKS